MKKIITLTAFSLLIAAGVSAQTVYDAAAITSKDLNGTARFVGMGGAMGALGGDISTIGVNPAGIGIYRSNDIMLSFGLSAYATESTFAGATFNSDKTRGSFDNIGFVLSTKIGNQTPLRYVNFGFNYKRAKSFDRNMTMNGNLGDYSQTFQMAAQADGITGSMWDDGNRYTNPDIGWLSALGYDGFLINPEITTEKTDYPYLDKNNKPILDDNGNPLFVNYGYYGSIAGANPNAKFRSEERGGIDQYDFNVSFNLNDRVYLGATVGAYSINYSKYTFYDEDFGMNEGYSLHSWNNINGAGFDLKMGMIVRPFEYSPLRIGLAIHTPTFYNLELATSARIESNVWNGMEGNASEVLFHEIDTYKELNNNDMIRGFSMHTPWTYNVSLGYTVGKSLALGAEYEYQDYSAAKFLDSQGYTDVFEYENSTMPMLKGVHSIRLGAEYKVIPQFALRAGYNYTSAAFHQDAYKDLPINSIQTDTDFANSQAKSNYTLGIGYRGSVLYADLAYKYSTYKEEFFPFIEPYVEDNQVVIATPNATTVTNSRSQVLLTIGMRF